MQGLLNTANPLAVIYYLCMRDSKRIKPLLEKLEAVWRKNPDYRFGQLIMVITKTGVHNPALFTMEEEEFMKKIEELEKQLDANENKL